MGRRAWVRGALRYALGGVIGVVSLKLLGQAAPPCTGSNRCGGCRWADGCVWATADVVPPEETQNGKNGDG